MNIVINNKISVFLEKIYSLLSVKHQDFLTEQYSRMGLTLGKEFYKLFNQISKIKLLQDDFLSLYFDNFCSYENVVNGNIFCLATSFYKIPDIFDYSFQEIIETLQSYSDLKIRTNILESLLYLTKKTSDYDLEDLLREEGLLVELLNHSIIREEMKWKLFMVLKEPGKYMAEFVGKLIAIDHELTKVLVPLNRLKEEWLKDVNLSNGDLVLQIIEVLKGKEYLNQGTVHIFPLFLPYNVIVSRKGREIYFGLGLHADQYFHAISGKDDLEYTTDLLKSLADNSKYTILTLLSDKKLYAQEIATRLNLTNATISHHMRAMTIQGLVKTSRIQNRTYYYLNKETFENLLSRISRDLLKNDTNR